MVSRTETLREYESSPGKFQAFCTGCGSPIFAYLASSPDVTRVRLGSLYTPFTKRPKTHTFIEDKALSEPIIDDLPQFEEWAPKIVSTRGVPARVPSNKASIRVLEKLGMTFEHECPIICRLAVHYAV